MFEISADQFRQNLKSCVDRCSKEHDIIKVKRKRGRDFVVISVEDWSAIEETLYLNRVPGMAKSIHKAAKESISKGIKLKDLKW